MNKLLYLTLTFILQLLTLQFISQEVFNQCFSFESDVPNIEIDSNSIWEIGEPSTLVLNNSFESQNSIATKLDSSYSSTDSSFFYVAFQDPNWLEIPNYLNTYHELIFEFDHRFLLDSIADHGEIDISLDNGITWYNIVNEEVLGDCIGGCLYNTNYFESTDETTTNGFEIKGDSDGWVHSTYYIDFEGIANDFYEEQNDYPSQFLFKFGLITDSTSVNEGWQIDNLCISYEIPNNIIEFTKKELIIAPNPSTGEFTIQNFIGYGVLNIYSITGKLALKKDINTSEIVKTDLKPGVYCIKFVAANNIYYSKLIVK